MVRDIKLKILIILFKQSEMIYHLPLFSFRAVFLTASMRRVGRGELLAEAVNIILSTFSSSMFREYFSFNPSNPLELSNRTKQQSTKITILHTYKILILFNFQCFQRNSIQANTKMVATRERIPVWLYYKYVFIFPKKLREKAYIFMKNIGMFLSKFYSQITGLVLSI